MSRIGKHPVTIPAGVDVKVNGQIVTTKGKLGELTMTVFEGVNATLENSQVVVKPANDTISARRMWATTRTLISNMVKGVSEGFQVNLDITGVGYRAAVQGRDLVLQLGYSHEIRHVPVAGITISAPTQTRIEIKGADRQIVGETAAKIRSYRPPEPYKCKGIRYEGEVILRKEGKKK